MYEHKNLSVLAYANGFTLWHYRFNESLSSLTPNYFDQGADMIRKDDRVVISGADFTADAVCIAVNYEPTGRSWVSTRIFNCVQFDGDAQDGEKS